MSLLALDGVDLYYEVHGEGPPVVFIHGSSGTHLTWWQTIAELRHSHTCLIYDQRGFGRSTSTKPYDVGNGHLLHEDLCRLVEAVGLSDQRLSVVGASMGTGPALYYAMEHQPQIERLVLVCGPGGIDTPAIARGWQERAARMQARQTQIASAPGQLVHKAPPVKSAGEIERFSVAYHPHGPVGEAMHLDSPALTFLYAEIMAQAGGPPTAALGPVFAARRVTAQEASGVRFPVLVVGGTEDSLFSPAELEEVASLFPNGRCSLFKGAGHAAYYERAHRFNGVLRGFLRSGHNG